MTPKVSCLKLLKITNIFSWEFDSFQKKLCEKVLTQNRQVIKKKGSEILKKLFKILLINFVGFSIEDFRRY